MQRVGHNDPNTTLSIYTHVTDAMNNEVKNKLQALVFKRGKKGANFLKAMKKGKYFKLLKSL